MLPRTGLYGGWPYSQPPNVPFTLNKWSPQAEGLMAWWPALGSRGASVLRDYVGNPSPTLPNDWGWGTDGCFGAVLVAGQTNDFILNTGRLAWTPTAFSVVWRAYPTSLNTPPYPGIGAVDGWGGFFFHTYSSDGQCYCGTNLSTRFTPVDLPAGTYTLNTWGDYCYTYDGSNGRFYKDGLLIAGPKAQDASGAWGGFQIDGGNVLYSDIVVIGRALIPFVVYQMAHDAKWDLYRPLQRFWALRSPVGVAPKFMYYARLRRAA